MTALGSFKRTKAEMYNGNTVVVLGDKKVKE
jgi:hypothetical protein